MQNQEVNKYIQKVNGEVNQVFEGKLMECFQLNSVTSFTSCYDKIQTVVQPLMTDSLLKAQWLSNDYLHCVKRGENSDCLGNFKGGMDNLATSVINEVKFM